MRKAYIYSIACKKFCVEFSMALKLFDYNTFYNNLKKCIIWFIIDVIQKYINNQCLYEYYSIFAKATWSSYRVFIIIKKNRYFLKKVDLLESIWDNLFSIQIDSNAWESIGICSSCPYVYGKKDWHVSAAIS